MPEGVFRKDIIFKRGILGVVWATRQSNEWVLVDPVRFRELGFLSGGVGDLEPGSSAFSTSFAEGDEGCYAIGDRGSYE